MALDFLGSSRQRRKEVLLGWFERLAPGAAVTFVAPDPAADTLALLQERHGGLFEWWPLEDGPPEWRILLVRRSRDAARQRRVLEFMDRDHGRFFELLAEVAQALEARQFAEARRRCLHLATGLRKHARMEEAVLLPVVAEKLGSPRGPAMLIRDQHVAIEGLLDLVEADCGLLLGEDGAAPKHLGERLDALQTLLREHVATENRILYPVVDHLLDEEERDDLVKRCQALG